MYPKLRKWGQKALFKRIQWLSWNFLSIQNIVKGKGTMMTFQMWLKLCVCKQELHRHDASRSLFMFFSKYRILYVLWCTPMHKAMYSASKPTFPPFKRLSKQSSQNSHPPFGLNKELEECEGLYYDPFVIHSLYVGLAKPLHCTHNLSLRRNKGPKVNILSHNSSIFILDQNRDLHF